MAKLKAQVTDNTFTGHDGKEVAYVALSITNTETGYSMNVKGLSKEQKILLGMQEIVKD